MQNTTLKQISEDVLKLAPSIQSEILKAFRDIKITGNVRHDELESNAQDITTELDHKIGQIYINEIFNKYSDTLTIDSEEVSERLGNGKIILRFDPLDGSKHFVKGIPMLASTAALVENGITQFAMVLDIFSAAVYSASRGYGSFLNGQPIKVSNNKIRDNFSFLMYESPNSNMYSKDPEKFATFSKQLEIISKTSYRMRNFGLSALSVCLVADGSCPAYIDFSGTTKIYDVEAAALIALEAGAVVGDINGNKSNNLDHSQEGVKKLTGNLLVANPNAFDEISKLLSVNS